MADGKVWALGRGKICTLGCNIGSILFEWINHHSVWLQPSEQTVQQTLWGDFCIKFNQVVVLKSLLRKFRFELAFLQRRDLTIREEFISSKDEVCSYSSLTAVYRSPSDGIMADLSSCRSDPTCRFLRRRLFVLLHGWYIIITSVRRFVPDD
jgi:hypothetical protein